MVFYYIDQLIKIDLLWAKILLEKESLENPDKALKYAARFFKIDAVWTKELIEKIVLADPVKQYDMAASPLFVDSNICKIMTNISKLSITTDIKKRMLLLIELFINDNLSLTDAELIANDERLLFKTLINIQEKNSYFGKKSIDTYLNAWSLRTVKIINDLHENPNKAVRFESVLKMTPEELYSLMVYSEEEIFTSSFNELFTLLVNKMKNVKMDGHELLTKLGGNRIHIFFRECSRFSRMNECVNVIPIDNQADWLERLVLGLNSSNEGISQSVAVADVMTNLDITKDSRNLMLMQKMIKIEYDRTNNPTTKLIYGLLGSISSKKALTEQTWFEKMGIMHPIQPLEAIDTSKLFNQQNQNIQRWFFYDDKDGHDSYKHWLNASKQLPGFSLKDNGSYVIVKAQKNDKTIVIYANKPDQEDNGEEEINAFFEESVNKPMAIIHRGHSYHADRIISQIPQGAVLVILGSCGGYNAMNEALDRAPDAHILATKGIGTMAVNDVLINLIDRQILSGNNIVWTDLWKQAGIKLGNNKDFRNYISPNLNTGALFLNTYNKLK